LDREQASLDFNRLYSDLLYWSDGVKARWAAGFWGAAEEQDPAAAEATV
jgi:hypothetical protein